ncbi:22670_t:CDS:2 [Dentiscutata erythropus]|uniref:22670_t:CDS:1 n=1 Tax=Dentiscutata erythropus TaxID=1348616 RepID=A0A9N9EU60_9GLOM|nr:22670_t:CDS:2 [Dentiscutata erythropus]
MSTDVIIEAGEEPNLKRFMAHKNILQEGSSFFKCALSSTWAKIENGKIVIKKSNITPNVFLIILDYIYSKSVIWDQYDSKDILDFLISADELLFINEVGDKGQHYLIKKRCKWIEQNLGLVTFTSFKYDDVLIKLKEYDYRNSDDYHNSDNYRNSADSFIFSFADESPINAQFSSVLPRQKAIRNYSDYGPCFGETDIFMIHDFRVLGNCTSKPWSYEKIFNLYNGHKSKSPKRFSIVEYEVFQVKFKRNNQNSVAEQKPANDHNYLLNTVIGLRSATLM